MQGGDDEAKVYVLFSPPPDKVQVSQVAKAYQSLCGVDLIDTLKKRFLASEIKQVVKILEGLPGYRNTEN